MQYGFDFWVLEKSKTLYHQYEYIIILSFHSVNFNLAFSLSKRFSGIFIVFWKKY